MVTQSHDVVKTPALPPDSELQAIAAGDRIASARFLKDWEPVIAAIAARCCVRHSDFDDLMQVGRVGLFKAVIGFRSFHRVPFGNYAKRAIKNGVVKEAVSLARQRQLDTGNSIDGVANRSYIKSRLFDELLFDLPPAHARIFRLLYVDGHSQREAATIIGSSQPRVAQLHSAMLRWIRESWFKSPAA